MSGDAHESIPQKQTAGVYEKHGGELTIKEIPVPQIGDDDILVKVLFTGVCHTDVINFIWFLIPTLFRSTFGKAIYPLSAKNFQSLAAMKAQELWSRWAKMLRISRLEIGPEFRFVFGEKLL